MHLLLSTHKDWVSIQGTPQILKSWIAKSLQENGIFAVGLGLSSHKIYLEIPHNTNAMGRAVTLHFLRNGNEKTSEHIQ